MRNFLGRVAGKFGALCSIKRGGLLLAVGLCFSVVAVAVVANYSWTIKYHNLSADQEGYFQSNGRSIYYKVWGTTGKPIILVHGWGTNLSHSWEAIWPFSSGMKTSWVEALLEDRRVIAFDALGHGLSDKPYDQSLYGYVPLSKDVINLMDHLGVEKADLLGYSMGAFMGEALLVSDQHRFSSMVLAGIGDEVPHAKEEAEEIAAALRTPNPKNLTTQIARDMRAYIDWVPGNDNEAMALAAIQMWPETYPMTLGGPALEQVTIPVLVVNGQDDYYAETADIFAAAMPGGQLKVIPGEDHLTLMMSQDFVNLVLRFLRDQDN